MCGFLFLATDSAKDGGFLSAFMGTKGLLTAFLSAFITVIVYNFFIKRNITIKMPKEVPPNISQVFKDIFPLSAVIIILYALDLIVRSTAHTNVANGILKLFEPLFTAKRWMGRCNNYLWCLCILLVCGYPWSINCRTSNCAITYANLEANLHLIQAGEHANNVITPGTQMFVVTMGGTGATLVVPFMFMWLTKSKRNKAIGRASVVPTFFGVNEPILFGAPLVLNPVFFIPFIFAPIANVWIFKFFVDVLGMNSFSIFLPWTTPGPLGIVMGTGFAFWSFVLAIVLIVVDVIIYYPFVKVYDEQILEEELGNKEANNELQDKVAKKL